jgi:hypothetical protein
VGQATFRRALSRRALFIRSALLSRGALSAFVGGGLVAVSVAVAISLAALTGGTVSAPGGTAHRVADAPAGLPSVSGRGDAMASLSLPRSLLSPSRRPAGAPSAAPGGSSAEGAASATPPRLVVPDVIAAAPGGVSSAQLAGIKRLGQVRGVLPIDGARVTVNGKPVTVLGAPASALRPWTPPATAASQQLWTEFSRGDLITTVAAAKTMNLKPGGRYPVSAAVRGDITFGGKALLGVTGVDAIVDQAQAKYLGLVKNVAVLVNAPAANMNALVSQIRSALGKRAQVIRLAPVEVSTNLPVDSHPPTGKPTSYLTLYQESAARYCPGLSWTVLAAIGQIESDHGTNMGPSSAGALGPMQFLPSTWKIWGTDGFGETGPPNIMDPFDAVPSAARMLCAAGAAAGGQQLRQAIFDYNHATWYVDEVLTLAGEYAREFA